MAIVNVHSREEFEKIINESVEPIVADFGAEWCTPCQLMKAEIEKLATELEGEATIVTVDADELKDVAILLNIQGVPTIIFFRDGREIDRVAGYKPASTLKSLYDASKKNKGKGKKL